MAIPIIPYTPGDPITPNVTYSLVQSSSSNYTWLLTSGIAEAHLQMTLTQPTDEKWSNVTTFHIDGEVAGRLIKIPDYATDYYFRVIGPPSLAYDSTLALKDLQMPWPADITPKPIPTDGTPIENGYYSLDALALPVGKFHSLSIIPANSGNLVGKHDTDIQNQFIATVFGVNASGLPVSHMCSLANTQQVVFNYDTAKAVLHLSAPEGAKFNFTCTIASFSPGSGGSLTPSSDATITGAWVFSNTISVPAPTAPGHAANKEYVDNQLGATVKTTGNQTISGVKTFSNSPVVPAPTSDTNAVNKQYVDAAIEAIPVFNPAEAQTISGSWNFTNGLTRTTKVSPVNTDIMNKQMSDALYVPATGNTTIAGTKTFSDGITLGDEKLLTLGIGANAMKIHGSGTGAAVIEGANGTSLDVAVSTDFSEPVTFQDTVTITAPAQVNGGVTFTAGVTIAQTLNVAGSAIFTGGIKGSKFESTVGNITFTNSSGIVTMVLTNADNTGSIFHKSLDPTDPSPSNSNVNNLAVYAVGQLDNRYAKLETSLTQAQYDALSIKDPRTFYFTSDTSKLYIGGTLVNLT